MRFKNEYSKEWSPLHHKVDIDIRDLYTVICDQERDSDRFDGGGLNYNNIAYHVFLSEIHHHDSPKLQMCCRVSAIGIKWSGPRHQILGLAQIEDTRQKTRRYG